MPAFTETLHVRAGATSELNPLLSISGQSTGMEVALGVDALPFGTVCAGSQRTQRLGLENRGDLPARFRCVMHGDHKAAKIRWFVCCLLAARVPCVPRKRGKGVPQGGAAWGGGEEARATGGACKGGPACLAFDWLSIRFHAASGRRNRVEGHRRGRAVVAPGRVRGWSWVDGISLTAEIEVSGDLGACSTEEQGFYMAVKGRSALQDPTQ